MNWDRWIGPRHHVDWDRMLGSKHNRFDRVLWVVAAVALFVVAVFTVSALV